MELFIKEILSGNNVAIGMAIFVIFLMHKSANEKLDKLTDAVQSLVKELAVTSEKLDHGDNRMTKIEERVEGISGRLHETNQKCMLNANEIKGLRK